MGSPGPPCSLLQHLKPEGVRGVGREEMGRLFQSMSTGQRLPPMPAQHPLPFPIQGLRFDLEDQDPNNSILLSNHSIGVGGLLLGATLHLARGQWASLISEPQSNAPFCRGKVTCLGSPRQGSGQARRQK